MEILKFNEFDSINEALPSQNSVDQLKRVMKMSAKTDIGNRISDMNIQGANIHYIQNPIETGIESYEDFEKNNKNFIPSWNLKHLLSPFSKKTKKKLLFESKEVLYNCKECNWKGWLPMSKIVTCPKCGNINDVWEDGEEIPKRHKELNDKYKKKRN